MDLGCCKKKFVGGDMTVILLDLLLDTFENLINDIEYGSDILTKEVVLNAIKAYDFKAKMK